MAGGDSCLLPACGACRHQSSHLGGLCFWVPTCGLLWGHLWQPYVLAQPAKQGHPERDTAEVSRRECGSQKAPQDGWMWLLVGAGTWAPQGVHERGAEADSTIH